MATLTNEQLWRAVDLLHDLVSISPATAPNADNAGVCHYCGKRVRNVHAGTIHHTEGCYWKQARDFLDDLPNDWGE